MITVRVFMKVTGEPLKRTEVALQTDADGAVTPRAVTDRVGVARFDLAPTSGKVLVAGRVRFQGRLEGEIPIAIWSLTQADDAPDGSPGGSLRGSTAYSDTATRTLDVGARAVLTDAEGYLVDPAEWCEDFARAQAAAEGLDLTAEHWDVLRFLRAYYARHDRQAAVRDMVKHFRETWGAERGTSRHLHALFPRGGPQKQGNRLAGLLRTKGEH